jgi:hypothetical protein
MNTRTKERHILSRLIMMPIDTLLQSSPIRIDSRFSNFLSVQTKERRHRAERRGLRPRPYPTGRTPETGAKGPTEGKLPDNTAAA